MARHIGLSKTLIWEFFNVSEDTKLAVCETCKAKVPRGGDTTKSFTTTNLIQNLTSKHPEVYAKYQERKANQGPKQPKGTRKLSIEQQLSSIEVQDLTKTWDINDTRALRVHRKVGEMVAIGCQPISVVEDVGFRQVLRTLEPRYQCPSRKYFTETIIPKIYSGMKEEVLKLLNNSNVAIACTERNYVSFTSNAWSSDVNNTSLLSLLAHWIAVLEITVGH